MSHDPISRLQFARDEVDRVFGEGYAAAHPDVVASVMLSASLDWAAMHLATAVRDVAAALVLEEEPGAIVRPTGLLQSRP
jgi:3-oxoacyl-[acyl-carrier-protein] synthase III